ncbi:Fatty acid hydroxylase - like 10, partial [Theobroma cacao]
TEAARMVKKPFTVDLNKPLVFQVGHLGEAYDKWVHQPVVSKECPRFFGNDFCELLTRTKWWVIPLVWLPVVCWFVSTSIQRGLTPTQAASAVAGGVFIWTLIEYTLHRFLFHMKTTRVTPCTFSFMAAITSTPWIDYDSFSPQLQQQFSVWSLFKLFSTPSTTPALFAGGLLGYVIYDCTHYYLHHGKPSEGLSQTLKRYHLNHHFRVQSKGFGITSSIWDHVFGTYPAMRATEKSR